MFPRRPVAAILSAFLLAVGAVALPATGLAAAKTGKERLSDKASDEQRVDDCNVPPARRGPTPRPVDACRRSVREGNLPEGNLKAGAGVPARDAGATSGAGYQHPIGSRP